MSAKEPDFILMQISLSSKTKLGEDDYNPCVVLTPEHLLYQQIAAAAASSEQDLCFPITH